MAANLYARLSEVKRALQGSGSSTTNDAEMLALIERVSRAVDEVTRRHFYSLSAQTLVLPERPRPAHVRSDRVWTPDLVSLTTVKVDDDGDGTYETTLTEDTDFSGWPYNRRPNQPIQALDLLPFSTRRAWPVAARGVQVVGMLGYSNETVSAGTLGASLNASATSVTLNAGHDIGAGDTLCASAEQMDVLSVSTNTATVTRGVNGTTAAEHESDATVSRRVYPRDVTQAVIMQSARLMRETQTGYSGSVGPANLGGFAYSSMYPSIRDLLDGYVLPAVA